MTRREALAGLGLAVALIVAGAVWLFGPYGLIGCGIVLGAVLLLTVDITEEEQRAEAVDDPASAPRRAGGQPLHRR